MKNTLILVLFPLFAIGVFGVELKSVSVNEGDSVTLHTGVQIQGSDEVEWLLKGKLIFIISSSASAGITVTNKTNGAFGGRLKVDEPSGDLEITNFKTTDSGEYELKISSTRGSSDTTFNVTGVLNTDRDPVKSVTVGESITLNTQIQSGEVIQWRFEPENTLIAEISVTANRIPQYHDVPDGRFKGRLKLDEDTGSLTITNIRITDSGVYKADIRSSRFTIHKTFTVAVRGVLNPDRDPVKSVTEGESITLKTQIQSDEEIQWLFGAENTLIAEISETANRIPQYHDVPDGRFRDRLKLDNRTGSLTIMNIRITDSGVYEADIRNSSRYTIHRTFTVIFQEVKSVSVMEGDSVSLHTGVTEIQRDDEILWRFGDRDVIIARLNGSDVFNKWINVNVNKQTGDLNINNIKRDHSGYYKVQINTINVISCRKYHIKIIDPSPKTTEITVIVILILIVIVLVIVLVIVIMKGRYRSSSSNEGVKENPSRQQMLDGEPL